MCSTALGGQDTAFALRSSGRLSPKELAPHAGALVLAGAGDGFEGVRCSAWDVLAKLDPQHFALHGHALAVAMTGQKKNEEKKGSFYRTSSAAASGPKNPKTKKMDEGIFRNNAVRGPGFQFGTPAAVAAR